MPATAKGQSNEQYVEYDEFIDFHVEKVRSNVKTTDILTAVVGVATMVLAYLLVFVACDHWLIPGGFDRTARLSMLGVLVLLSIGWIVWKVVLPARRRVNPLYAADTIERASPDLLGNLRNLVDVRRSGREPSVQIARTMEKRAAVSMSNFDTDAAVDRRRLTNFTYVLLAVVVLACAYTIFSPKPISNSIWRALFPTSNVSVATRTEIIDVDPGSVEIVARSRIDVTVDLAGEAPESVTLFYTTADQRFVDEPIELRESPDLPKRYVGTIVGENGKGILQDLDYLVRAGDAESETYHVTVLQPPSATVEQVEVVFPEYTRLEPKTRQGGHVEALEGSAVTWHASTNQKVKRAVLQFSDTEIFSGKEEEIVVQVGPEGRQLTATIDPWKKRLDKSVPPFPKYYRMQVWNDNGDSDPEPIVHTIDVDLDLPPDIALVDPREDLVDDDARPVNGSVPLTFFSRDDFGVRYVSVVVRRAGQRIHAEPIFEGEKRYVEPKQPYVLQLHQPGRLELKPGDTIEVVLRSKDNKEPNAQATDTPPLLVEIAEPATEEELEQQRREDEQRRERRLDEADREPNPDADPMGDGERRDGEGDPGEEPQPGEEPGEGEQPTDGMDGGEGDPNEGDPNGGDRPGDQAREGGRQGENRDAGPGDTASEPLPNDGTRDDEATQKLIEEFNRNRDQADRQPNDANREGNPNGGERGNPNDVNPDGGNDRRNDPGAERKPSGDSKPGEQPQPGEREPGERNTPGNEMGDMNSGEGSEPEAGTDPMKADPKDPNGGTGAGGEKPPEGGMPGDASNGTPMPGTGDDPGTKPEPGAGEPAGGDPGSAKPMPGDAAGGREKPDDPNSKAPVEPGDPKNGTKEPGDPNAETKPGDAEGGTRKPGESDPNGKQPRNTGEKTDDPGNTKPKPGEPNGNERKPGEPKPGEPNTGGSKPGEPKSAEPKPGDTNPGDGDPNEPNRGDGGENPKPGEPKPGDPNPSERQPGEPGDTNPNDPMMGEPGPGEGEPGEGKPGNEDQPGERKPGEGEPGEGEPGDQGQPGEGEPGEGETVRGEGKPGEGKPGDGKPGENEAGEGEPGEGEPGDGTQPGDTPAGNNPAGGDRDGGRGQVGPDKPLDDPGTIAETEDARKATELVLKRLRDQLDRGEIDDDLREQLGWSDDQMRRYLDRMQKRLELLDDQPQSPETAAQKRQFQEMLKSLDLKSTGDTRDARTDRRRVIEGFGGRESRPPAEYGEAFDAYTRDLPRLLRQKKRPRR